MRVGQTNDQTDGQTSPLTYATKEMVTNNQKVRHSDSDDVESKSYTLTFPPKS